ncbi:response regulator transcription factor [Novosphingobium album (ex Liu et al. 2023)]|uniref:Response regulator transcription factor n=1 Tax=Novosphingobium album (ex Liu et al. 2023) TaxID=3031130 RepID=A0ABT5WSF2_9SPHN|nr:response regulator transcription factor [Novosphingobium album (ex Liu et al. 2023)]MDE8652784.1 response regulator transcription factor [Novosphingobium album (ex Liu et al. 2023)]
MSGDDRRLLIVEDDASLARTLLRSFERRGYAITHAANPNELSALVEAGRQFDYAVIDLKLGTASGLTCVQSLHRAAPATLIVVLTGFASIATAVEAIKLGASYYLAKPANTDDIEDAFGKSQGDPDVPVEGRKSSIKTVEWEYIQTTLAECDFNISEAARRLGMHRRTLARKLDKRQIR